MKLNRYNFHKISVIIALILFFTGCAQSRSGIKSGESGSVPEPVTVATGNYCGVSTEMNLIISDIDEWQRVWALTHENMYPVPELPEIDFSSQTILAVFLGYRSTGGYNIKVERIENHNSFMTAIISTTSPGADDMVTMAISQPFHIVSVNISGTGFEFKREK